MDIPVPHLELLALAFVIVQEVNRKRPPLRRARVEVPVLDVQITGGDRLRAEPVEQRDFGTGRDAQVGVLERLFLFGGFRDDFDSFAVEHADVVSGAVEHFYGEHEVFALVRVGYVEGFRGAVLLAVVEVELLHVLVRVADADEGAELGGLFGFAFAEHLFLAQSPAITEEVYARGRAEEAFFVAVRLLGDFCVKDDDDHVGSVA